MNNRQKKDKIKEIRALVDRALYEQALSILLGNLNQLVENKEYRDEILSINEKYYDTRDKYKLEFIDVNEYEMELSTIKFRLQKLLNKAKPGRISLKKPFPKLDIPEEIFQTEIEGKFKNTRSFMAIVSMKEKPKITINVKKGDASPEVIADLLSEISILYRKTGGSGINFSLENIRIDQNVTADE